MCHITKKHFPKRGKHKSKQLLILTILSKSTMMVVSLQAHTRCVDSTASGTVSVCSQLIYPGQVSTGALNYLIAIRQCGKGVNLGREHRERHTHYVHNTIFTTTTAHCHHTWEADWLHQKMGSLPSLSDPRS